MEDSQFILADNIDEVFDGYNSSLYGWETPETTENEQPDKSVTELILDFVSLMTFETKEVIVEYNESGDPVLPEQFLREHADLFDEAWGAFWELICRTQVISEDFIRDFQEKVDWPLVSKYQKLSDSFIREFKEKVYWPWIWEHQNVSYDFIQEFNPKRPTQKIKDAIQKHHQYLTLRTHFPCDIADMIMQY